MIIGIDDAGRGPLIGPMYLAGVLLTPEQEAILKQEGITDSKALAHSSRLRMAAIIKKNCTKYHVVESTPAQIDKAVDGGVNLNTLEAQKTADIINELNDKDTQIKVVVDCPSVNTMAWRGTLLEYVHPRANLQVICEHKADANHISAAAGSILAKVAREEAVMSLKQQYGDFGSGYPADPKTKSFLENKGKELADTGIFRKSWSTWKKMYPAGSTSKDQRSLSDF